MKIRKCVAMLLAAVFMILAFPLSAGAEELKAPVVQFKLINHDEIALRWSKIEGADYYRIYRTDVATGKMVKYKNPIKKTEVNIKGLTAETEYIFKVAAVSEKDGEIVTEVKSKGTHVTTPKEWYYKYGTIKETRERRAEKGYFRENYSGTVQEKLKIKNIGTIIAYCDGWIYFIANRGVIAYDIPTGMCIGRIREDGTGKEILFDDFGVGNGLNYRYKVHGDYIYLYRETSSDGFYDRSDCTYESDYHKISLKTGEVSKICDVFVSSYTFDVYDDYVYFRYYQLEYNEETEGYDNRNGIYFCRAEINGAGKENICDFSENDVEYSDYMYTYNDEVYFYSNGHDKKIHKMPLTGGDIQEISISENYLYINNFEIVNGYIYFTQYSYLSPKDEYTYTEKKQTAYYRLKTDGTGLTKQKKPFEWKY